jgi:hypothetical protein
VLVVMIGIKVINFFLSGKLRKIDKRENRD